MFRQRWTEDRKLTSLSLILTLGIAIASAALVTIPNQVNADCKLPGKNHDDNNPSSKKFFKMAYSASLCQIAICVDSEECSNHDKVNWEKFQSSPAFINEDQETQQKLAKANAKGNGMDGLGGYEILDYVIKDK